MPNFTPWPKTARLNRDIVVTEKIDGTNAAIIIDLVSNACEDSTGYCALVEVGGAKYKVGAQSRTRIITPGKDTDNHGFAGWVAANAEMLVSDLGAGLHFGEWWGSGIQRGYGLEKGVKRFSLFNTHKWWDVSPRFVTPNLYCVPIIYTGPFSEQAILNSLTALRAFGSLAAPDFKNPEGICIFHTAAGLVLKVTLDGDEKPKGQQDGSP